MKSVIPEDGCCMVLRCGKNWQLIEDLHEINAWPHFERNRHQNVGNMTNKIQKTCCENLINRKRMKKSHVCSFQDVIWVATTVQKESGGSGGKSPVWACKDELIEALSRSEKSVGEIFFPCL
jgi:hypothetical protein